MEYNFTEHAKVHWQWMMQLGNCTYKRWNGKMAHLVIRELGLEHILTLQESEMQ